MIGKYDKDGPFNDPVIRCCDCQALIYRTVLRDKGTCPKCGNRRVRNVLAMSDEEMVALKRDEVDPEFLALFQEKENDGLVVG